MPEQPSGASPSPSDLQARVHAIAEFLRQADHLGPEAQQALAELVDELGNMLRSTAVPSAEMAQLTDSTAHLVQALHPEQDAEARAVALGRLEEAVLRVENKAPTAAGILHRLVETLSNIGI